MQRICWPKPWCRRLFAIAPPEVRQRVFLQGAEIARREADTAQETRYLKLALDSRPGQSYYANLARQRLAEMGRAGQ